MINYDTYKQVLNLLILVRDEGSDCKLERITPILLKEHINKCMEDTLNIVSTQDREPLKNMIKQMKSRDIDINNCIYTMRYCLNILYDNTAEDKTCINCLTTRGYDFYYDKDYLYFISRDRVTRKVSLKGLTQVCLMDYLDKENIFNSEELSYISNCIRRDLGIAN